MYQKDIKKTVYTLNINNYAPELLEFTRPFLDHWIKKIGANHFEIKDRKYPNLDIEMEKLQIYDLAQIHQNDWSIYIDLDALVHPELFDITDHLNKDTVLHVGNDFAGLRWSYDRFFRRDGRHIGSCNWFAMASDWNIELWKMPEDITYDEMIKNIHPLPIERHTVIKPAHLVTDYILSRNIAKYGLKFQTLNQICIDNGMPDSAFFYHLFLVPLDKKIESVCEKIYDWYNYSLGFEKERCEKLFADFKKLSIEDKKMMARKTIKMWDLS
jgi:hypothetical protein